MGLSFDELIETITPAIGKNSNMREAVTLPQGSSITLGHLATEFGFEDLVIPIFLMFAWYNSMNNELDAAITIY